ncbi:MAG: DUF4404 family protein [Halieaceae bacterium]|nr:DUF4404 family protein [Halieaceae bacterium]
MSKEQVYQDLSSLLNEIDSLPLEEAERRRLHGLVSDIEQHLDTDTEGEASGELDIGDTVDEMVTRLEADHPAFTGILRRIMNTLSSMGV